MLMPKPSFIQGGLSDLASFFAARLFPKTCFVCTAEGQWLCPSCLGRLPLASSGICLFCNQPAGLGVCPDCRAKGLDAYSASLDYRFCPLARLIHAYKYRFARDIGQVLAPLLAENFQIFRERCASMPSKPYWLNKRLLVVPLPLAKRREGWRGFNQAADLAQSLARGSGYDYSAGLIKIKNTRAQAKLNARQRESNLQGAYEWRGEDLSGRIVVLVDDIATTGSTLAAAAGCLKASGAATIIGLTLARQI